MPLLGAHLSIAGGLHNAIASALALGMDTVQIFTKNASQWAAKPLTSAEIETFRTAWKKSKLKYATAHDSYLINLAAPGDELYRKSIDAFTHEVERAESLGLSYLVMHPGAHVGSGEENALKRVIAAFDEVHARTAGYAVKVLVETTAGQGTTLGCKFEHIQTILDGVKEAKRLGVCVDTCHIFAAGYPVDAATFETFDDLIGIKRIGCFHLNDSVKGLGCRVDRHAGIGLGMIGEEPFRWLVNDKRFAKLPMYMETPKEDAEKRPMDPVNLAKLRSFKTVTGS